MSGTPMAPDDTQRSAERSHAPERVPLTHRVNVEPSVLRGMTVTEAKVLAAISIPVCLILGVVLLLFTGLWQLMLLPAIFGPIAALWFGSAKLQDLKRGRPDGYYTQALHLWFARKGLTRGRFLTHHGQWSLGRSLPFSLSHPLDPQAGRSLWHRLARPRRTPHES